MKEAVFHINQTGLVLQSLTCDNYSTNLGVMKLLGVDPNNLLKQDVNETDQIVTNLKGFFF